MELSKLEKEVNHLTKKCKITLEIVLDPTDFADYDYQGFDMIDDNIIPDLLYAVSKRYVRMNKVLREKVGTIA